ncbi:YbaB/EbfC family nucleoid-associated protein [Actinokineospora sp. 24-640]
MNERVPVERTTQQLIDDGRARQEALAGVEKILEEVRGTAHDEYQTVRVTVDGRGRLLDLWLRQDAVRWGADLGRVIVHVAHAAMDDATQAGYNRLAPLLGDNLTYAMELVSGHAAPARREARPGITAEEFQRRRDERMAQQHQQQRPGRREPDPRTDEFDPEDPLSFDVSFLRSDR